MGKDQANEIILYQLDNTLALDVRVEDESVWLTQAQILELSNSSKTNISEHLKRISESDELNREVIVRKFRMLPDFERSWRGCTGFFPCFNVTMEGASEVDRI